MNRLIGADSKIPSKENEEGHLNRNDNHLPVTVTKPGKKIEAELPNRSGLQRKNKGKRCVIRRFDERDGM